MHHILHLIQRLHLTRTTHGQAHGESKASSVAASLLCDMHVPVHVMCWVTLELTLAAIPVRPDTWAQARIHMSHQANTPNSTSRDDASRMSVHVCPDASTYTHTLYSPVLCADGCGCVGAALFADWNCSPNALSCAALCLAASFGRRMFSSSCTCCWSSFIASATIYTSHTTPSQT